MTEYISREAMLKNLTADLEHHSGEGDSRTHLVMQRFIKYVEDFPAADVKLVISGDNCIVCGHDVRKDNVYYDVNGGMICESCMNTKFKCKNGR